MPRFSAFQITINFDFTPKIDPRYGQTQESGVGSGLIFETITGKLLKPLSLAKKEADLCLEVCS
jgi:hypothetical protein